MTLNVSKSVIQISNSIIRNEQVKLNATEFVMLLFLKKYYFLNGKKDELELDPKKLMCNIEINDNRTFKKSLGVLYQQGFLKEEIDKIPRGKPMIMCLNMDNLESKTEFTQLPTGLLDRLNDIGHMGIRLLYLYESYINRHNASVHFCFVGFSTIEEMFKCSSKTIGTYNNLLVKHKLLKITRHKLKTDYEYNDDNALVFEKFNNHYEVRLDNI